MTELNKNQLEATCHSEGPLLIIAGPGSGKTKTIIERTINILKKEDVSPSNIILATFTDKAARELKTRISKNIDRNIDLSSMYLGTIHSIAMRIIDENLNFSYLEKSYVVLDELEQHFLIYKNLKIFEELEGWFEFFQKFPSINSWDKSGKLKKWINKFSEEENLIISNPYSKFLALVHKKYLNLLQENNLIDFPNIQKEALRILRDNSEVLSSFQEKIKYVIIDEYQDTNSIQEKLFLLISDKIHNICVVGDDDQGIYRFRGASVKNILRFKENFPENLCTQINLDINYRSSEDIVNFSNEWITSLNWEGWRYEKNLVSGKNDVNKTLGVVKISSINSEKEWKEKIYKFLLYLKSMKKIKDYNQVAFLFSSIKNSRVKRLASYLESKGIHVYSPRANNYFERDEVKFVLGYFISVFSFELHIKYNIYFKECFNFFLKEIKQDEELIKFTKEFRQNIRNIKKNGGSLRYKNFLDIFYTLFQFESFKKYLDFEEQHILENRFTYNLGIFSKILKKFDNLCKIKNITEENLDKILNYFFDFHLNFLKKHGINEFESDEFPSGAVSFLTIHQSKGLEFPFVIVGSLERGPDFKDMSDEKALDLSLTNEIEPSNRINEFDFWRMFYVGFSRARNLLALTTIENNLGPSPSPSFKKVYNKLVDIRSHDFQYQNLNFDSISTSKLKESFSFTGDIKIFDTCPRLFKFLKVYNFEINEEASSFFGNLVHLTLEDVNNNLKNKINLSEDQIKDTYHKNYVNLQRKLGLTLSNDILKKGYRNILDYINNYSNIHDYIKDTEIKVSLNKDDYIIEGIIDLVVEKDDLIEIIDFKTEYNKKSHESYIEQLKIYSYLLSKKYNKPIKKSKIFYLDFENDNKIFEISISSEDISIIMDKFDDITKKIINNNFDISLDNSHCEFCPLKTYCIKI